MLGVDLGEGPPFRGSMWKGNAKSKEEMGDGTREQNSNTSRKRDWPLLLTCLLNEGGTVIGIMLKYFMICLSSCPYLRSYC